MGSFDSIEDLQITKTWYKESRVADLSYVMPEPETFWEKIYNQYRREYGNPKRRTLQQIHDRYQIIQKAICDFIEIQQRLLKATRITMSSEQFHDLVKAGYLEEKGEAFTYDDCYNFMVSKIPDYESPVHST
ncbi:uncharacterized protein LOC113361345 [Papaver somniferum]|uniref:uncharacterized protein LOC113361345 n=1 Tax=Papaver somniferum TaxID=3469 RepID=UPI000E6FAB9A|nr:uncharacterized protein LOC113361345 [Papaver somniferum]